MRQNSLRAEPPALALLLVLLVIAQVGVVPHSRLPFRKAVLVRMNIIAGQLVLRYVAVRHKVHSNSASVGILEPQKQMSENNMENLVFKNSEHELPSLIMPVLVEEGIEEFLAQVHLQEALAGNTTNGGSLHSVALANKHLLKLLDDVTIEFLVPSKMHDAPDKFFTDR